MAQRMADALTEYLNGQEWQHTVDMFVRSNCHHFHDPSPSGHALEQYRIWQDFKEVVEQILEVALSSIGGSIEALEKALDEIASVPAKGPKDAVVKEILNKLLSFDSFESFCTMMYKARQENDLSGQRLSSSSSWRDKQQTLTSMGFNEVLVQVVLDDSPPDASIEDLVMRLSAMMDAAEAQRRPQQASDTGSRSFNRLASEATGSPSPGFAPASSPVRGDPTNDALAWFTSYLRKEAPDYVPGSNGNYASEIIMLFNTAQQILDAYQQMSGDNSSHRDTDMSKETMVLVQWSADMKDLLESVVSFCLEGYGTDESSSGSGGRSNQADILVHRFCELEDTRRRVEQSGVTSAAEMRRMKALEAIASMGTSDEQQLHRYISRYEECQAEVEVVHRRIALLVSPGGVRREAIEELYLYLKEQVNSNSGVDLESLAEEMHDKVYTLVDSAKGGEVVGVLLDIHVLEDEQRLLRQQIDAHMSSPSAKSNLPQDVNFGDKQQKLVTVKDEDQHGLRENTSEVASASVRRLDNEFAADEKIHSKQTLPPPWQEFKDEHGNIYYYNSETKESSWEFPGEAANPVNLNFTGGVDNMAVAASARDTKVIPSSTHGESNDTVASLKRAHEETSRKLEDALAAEKARKLQILEDRLMRRQQLRAKGGSDLDGTTDAELEQEIYEQGQKMDHLAKNIMSGFKKRCYYEMKATKESGGRKLSEEELDEAARAAAENLKQRYVRDQRSLLESLQTERTRQKNRLLKAMEKKKLGLTSEEELLNHEDLVQRELAKMLTAFEMQESTMLAGPQSNFFNSMAAIFMDKGILSKSVECDAREDGDDEDEYLSESKLDSALPGRASQWLDGITNLSQTYDTASEMLRRKLGEVERICDDDEIAIIANEEGETAAFGEVTAHMLGVVAEAYKCQLNDKDLALARLAKGDVDMNRIKAGILEEFEKSREGYAEALERARLVSKRRMEQRKGEGKGDEETSDKSSSRRSRSSTVGPKDDAMPSRVEAMFEEVVDSFLDDPTTIPVSWPAQKSSSVLSISRDRRAIGGVQMSPDKTGRGKSKKVEPSDYLNGQEVFNELEKDRIRGEFEKREANLLDEFQQKIEQKKKNLADRLRRKKESKISSKDSGAFDIDAEDEVKAASEELVALENSVHDLVSMVKSLDESQAKQVSVDSLMGAMEKMLKGEVVSTLTLTMPSAMEHPKKSFAPAMHFAGADAEVDRDSLKEEVKRISSVYSEEQQKLDLMMKLQQSRQRQALQRKLLERKQAWNTDDAAGGGSADVAEPKVIRRTDGPIPFGGARVVNQPSFRMPGLSSDTSSSPDSKAGAYGSSSIASRGLSVTNMLRK